LSGELKPGESEILARHVAECPDCREWAAFHRSLDAAMDRPVSLPQGLQERALLRAAAARQKQNWLTRLTGDPRMRKLMISSTTLAAVAACLIILVPRMASAETPAEALENIANAFAEASSRGEITVFLHGNGDGTVNVKCTHNGGPLPSTFPVETKVTDEGDNIIAVEVTVSFKPDQYSVIKYGKDKNTLELVPKSNPNQRIEIGLDPKTRVPEVWTTFNRVGEKWVMTTTALKDLKMTDHKEPARILTKPTVRMYKNQDAQVMVIFNG
jgi:hypothetical protein